MKNIFFFFLIVLSFENLRAQDVNLKELIQSNYYDDKFSLESMQLKGKVKSIYTYISEVLDNPADYQYKKNKLYFFEFKFNKKGKLVSRGTIDGPSYFPIEYSFKDTIIYNSEGKLKEVRTQLYEYRKNITYFDSNENEIKNVNYTGDLPSLDDLKTTTYKSYKYNKNKNIIEEIEYSSIIGNDTLNKEISNRYTYTYNGNSIISIKQEIEIINLMNSLGRKSEDVPLFTTRKYNAKNKVIEEKCESKAFNYILKYDYEDNGNLKRIVYNSTEVNSLTTYKNNLIATKVIQNMKLGINENSTYNYEFDSNENVIKVIFTSTNSPGSTVLIEREIVYYE